MSDLLDLGLIRRIPALEEKLDRVISEKKPELPIWVNLKRACEYKGVNYGTVKGRYWMMPCGGKSEGLLSNRHVWRRETIEEWSQVTDEKLASYLARFGITFVPRLHDPAQNLKGSKVS